MLVLNYNCQLTPFFLTTQIEFQVVYERFETASLAWMHTRIETPAKRGRNTRALYAKTHLRSRSSAKILLPFNSLFPFPFSSAKASHHERKHGDPYPLPTLTRESTKRTGGKQTTQVPSISSSCAVVDCVYFSTKFKF